MLTLSLHAQVESLNSGPEPKEGISQLTQHYLDIDFTRAQRVALEHKSLELIFQIDSTGTATLEDVNGITDQYIIDSLRHTSNRFAKFIPANYHGHKIASIYSLQLEYPVNARATLEGRAKTISVSPPQDSEFDDVQKGGRTDCVIGGVINGFAGNANKYLGIGGGMKVDVLYTGKRGFGGGIFMNAYFSDLKQDYPINTTRNQDGSQAILIIGLALSKTISLTDRREVIIQFEPAYALQNVSTREYTNDPDYIQFDGFSPGASVHYLLKIGNSRPRMYYFQPALMNSYLNFHFSVHPLFFDMSEGSGLLWDIGVSWRLSYLSMRSYKIRE